MPSLQHRFLSWTRVLVVCGFIVWQGASPAAASPSTPPVIWENQRLMPTGSAHGQSFGASVSVDGASAIVGAGWGSGPGQGNGVAYVFQDNGLGTWTQRAALAPSDPAAVNAFGASVALDGQLAVIGAPQGANYIGSAYIFRENGSGNWTQVAKLAAADGAAHDLFGFPVAISGNRVIIGASENDDAGSNSGSAYIFEDNGSGTWSQVAKLTASDATYGDEFGLSVGISGNTAIVSAHNDEGSGSAYVFEFDGFGSWKEVVKLKASDPGFGEDFGYSIAIEDDRAVVGARRDAETGYNSGAAYVFEKGVGGVWAETAKLTPADAVGSGEFGSSVDLSGTRILVGAENGLGPFGGAGSAYVFEQQLNGDWLEVVELNASDPAYPKNEFGWNAALSGDVALVGAWARDFSRGSAYLYKLSSQVPEPASLGLAAVATIAMAMSRRRTRVLL